MNTQVQALSTEVQFSNVIVTAQQNISASGTTTIVIPKGKYSKDYTVVQFPIKLASTGDQSANQFLVGETKFLDAIDRLQVTWDGIPFENTLEPAIIMQKKWDAFNHSKNQFIVNNQIRFTPQLQLNGSNGTTIYDYLSYNIGHLLNCMPQSQDYFLVQSEMIIELYFKDNITIPICGNNLITAKTEAAGNPLIYTTTVVNINPKVISGVVACQLDNEKQVRIIGRKYNNLRTDDASYGIRQKYFQSRQSSTAMTVSFEIPPGTFSQYQLYGYILKRTQIQTDANNTTIIQARDLWDVDAYISRFDKDGQYYIQSQNLVDCVQQVKSLNKNQNCQYRTMCFFIDNILMPGKQTINVTGDGTFGNNYWYVYGYQYLVEG